MNFFSVHTFEFMAAKHELERLFPVKFGFKKLHHILNRIL